MAVEHLTIVILCIVALLLIFYVQVEKLRGYQFLVEENYKENQELKKEISDLSSAVDIAKEALSIADKVRIEQEAIKKSTHTVIPVGNEAQIKKLEDDLRKVMGVPEEDFSQDLVRHGYTAGNEEDLV